MENPFEKQNSLSEEQQEKLDVISTDIKMLILGLKISGEADDTYDLVKEMIKKQGLDLSEEQIDSFIKSVNGSESYDLAA